MRLLDDRSEIVDLAVAVRILKQQTERLVHRQRIGIADLQADPEWLRTAAHDVNRLRKAALGNEKGTLLPSRRFPRLEPMENGHGFSRRGSLVEERRRSDVHSGQVFDDGLKVQEGLEPALSDFRLVRRVRRVPAWILENIAEDDARRNSVVVAHSDVRTGGDIASSDLCKPSKVSSLGIGLGQIKLLRQSNAGGYRLIDQFVDRRNADRSEHRVARDAVRANMSTLKSTRGLVVHSLSLPTCGFRLQAEAPTLLIPYISPRRTNPTPHLDR